MTELVGCILFWFITDAGSKLPTYPSPNLAFYHKSALSVRRLLRILGSLSNDIFERRTSTGSDGLYKCDYPEYNKFGNLTTYYMRKRMFVAHKLRCLNSLIRIAKSQRIPMCNGRKEDVSVIQCSLACKHCIGYHHTLMNSFNN